MSDLAVELIDLGDLWLDPETGEVTAKAGEGDQPFDLEAYLARKLRDAKAQQSAWEKVAKGLSARFIAMQAEPTRTYGDTRITVVRGSTTALAFAQFYDWLEQAEVTREDLTALVHAAKGFGLKGLPPILAETMASFQETTPNAPYIRATAVAVRALGTTP